MKKKSSIILIVTIVIGIIILNPIICHAWDVDNVSVSNVVVRDGIFNSFDFHFEVPSDLGETQSWLGLQSVQFQNGDFTDRGAVYDRNYSGPNAVMNDDDFRFDYGIKKFSKNSFPCFGSYSNVTTTFSGFSIKDDVTATYYVYLWTYSGSFYPDKLLATVEFNNGTIRIVDASENEMVNGTFEDFEAEAVDKIEINNVNFELKVGEEVKFTGEIKNNSNRFEFVETFMSKTRESRFESNDEYATAEERKVQDFKYFHISDITIKDNVNLKFDENTKVYINGVEQKKENIYVSYDFISVSDENNLIIPLGYVAPVYLDEDFEKEQNDAFEEVVLQAIRDGKVKYDTEETKATVDAALENNKSISLEIYVSESIAKSRWSYFFDEETHNALNKKIGNDYKFASYYEVCIIVYVDGYFEGILTEIPNALPLTIPFPNGIPTLKDGYQRVWKVLRYHNGEVVELDAKRTENGISFDNDKYSILALVYKDIKSDEKDIEIKNPKTGDTIMSYMLILGVSIVGLGTVGFMIKKDN